MFWFTDFIEERRQILEVVGPDLQAVYDEHQIEVRVERKNCSLLYSLQEIVFEMCVST